MSRPRKVSPAKASDPYDIEKSKEAWRDERQSKMEAEIYKSGTQKMRELIEDLKPSNVSDLRAEMLNVLGKIIEEMQCQ